MPTAPKFEEISIDEIESKDARNGIYVPMYNRLVELADKSKGLVIHFTSNSAGNNQVSKFAQWAAEDGYEAYSSKLTKGSPDDPRRYIYLKKAE